MRCSLGGGSFRGKENSASDEKQIAGEQSLDAHLAAASIGGHLPMRTLVFLVAFAPSLAPTVGGVCCHDPAAVEKMLSGVLVVHEDGTPAEGFGPAGK